ncbi:hypothetical protein BDQ12DRAFT_675783 [Crucibulum laeve]|uniref:Uncharacterized protein n=1 Tax=Crucibulum laeve TaxID=68775 RepID=A0A5C3MES7_9AGAR|nr:hypothetical protein BDQ12DRAFT_675783 [Crucibulum laeve]
MSRNSVFCVFIVCRYQEASSAQASNVVVYGIEKAYDDAWRENPSCAVNSFRGLRIIFDITVTCIVVRKYDSGAGTCLGRSRRRPKVSSQDMLNTRRCRECERCDEYGEIVRLRHLTALRKGMVRGLCEVERPSESSCNS